MRIKNVLGFFLLLIILTACEGDANNILNHPPNNSPKSPSLLPLTISLHDESGNPIQYIAAAKISSHYDYKLTLTNSNSFK